LPGSDKTAKRTLWTAGAFYLLIALEFFYMASPFAIYFYSAYLPGLKFLNSASWTAWLTTFFLPHFAPTSSVLVNAAAPLGALLTAAGLVGFIFAATQVYSRKLRRRGAATGGLYQFVRHPQYSFLILAGIGMLLLWPRHLMVVFFVTMFFAYHALARIEERECARKFGQSYIDYQNRTPRFLPMKLQLPASMFSRPASRPGRLMAGVALYAMLLTVSLLTTAALQQYTVNRLIAAFSGNSAYIALTRLDPGALRHLADAAAKDPRVLSRINNAGADTISFINYVMPWDWAITEIPMNGARGHHTPAEHDSRFKIVYTRSHLLTAQAATGTDILRYTVRTSPVFEAWLDNDARVVRIVDPPVRAFYGDVPVPIY
jgi:protein-S-isoprenylcysteine O-methyltransferase Ste14